MSDRIRRARWVGHHRCTAVCPTGDTCCKHALRRGWFQMGCWDEDYEYGSRSALVCTTWYSKRWRSERPRVDVRTVAVLL